MKGRETIVAAARLWIGTPYRHQMAVRGAGTDCLGLLRGLWRDVYGAEPENPPAYSPDWDEVARRDVLRDAARRHLSERKNGAVEPGDVLLFRMRQGAVAKHLGVVSDEDAFIHAYSGHGVVESRLSAPWRRRIVGVFSFPALD